MGLYRANLNMAGVKRYATATFPDTEETFALVRAGHLTPVEVTDDVRAAIANEAPKPKGARDVDAVRRALEAARAAAGTSSDEPTVETAVSEEPAEAEAQAVYDEAVATGLSHVEAADAAWPEAEVEPGAANESRYKGSSRRKGRGPSGGGN